MSSARHNHTGSVYLTPNRITNKMAGKIKIDRPPKNLPNLFTKSPKIITLVFAARYPGGEVTLNPEEHEEYAWIDSAEIGKYKTVRYLEGCLNLFFKSFHSISDRPKKPSVCTG